MSSVNTNKLEINYFNILSVAAVGVGVAFSGSAVYVSFLFNRSNTLNYSYYLTGGGSVAMAIIQFIGVLLILVALTRVGFQTRCLITVKQESKNQFELQAYTHRFIWKKSRINWSGAELVVLTESFSSLSLYGNETKRFSVSFLVDHTKIYLAQFSKSKELENYIAMYLQEFTREHRSDELIILPF